MTTKVCNYYYDYQSSNTMAIKQYQQCYCYLFMVTSNMSTITSSYYTTN